MATERDDEQATYEEELGRLNSLCKVARESGAVISVNAETPMLDDDGVLLEGNEEES